MTTKTDKPKYACPAELCDGEYTLTATGMIRRHQSKVDPQRACPGSGHPPGDFEGLVEDQQERTAAEWDRVLSQGEKAGEDTSIARRTYERAINGFKSPGRFSVPEGMTQQQFDSEADAWLSEQLAIARSAQDGPLSLEQIATLRSKRFQAIIDRYAAQAARDAEAIKTEGWNADGERGVYFRAGYPGDCSECGAPFSEGDEIRADGEGDWQARACCGDVEDEAAAEAGPPSAESFFGNGGIPAQRPAPAVEELPVPPWAGANGPEPVVAPIELPPPPWIAAAESAAKPQAPTPEEFFAQPERAPRRTELPPMSDLGAAITERFKEIFFSYVNRDSADNRSAQTHLGPSEIGSPCDRRIALSLMRVPACNPGGDSWASFKGTAIHAELAKMFEWANHGTGRFETEVRLDFPHAVMPHGTTDLLDRVLCLALDHKVQGATAADALRTLGPAEYYIVQAMVYAYGARLRGEEIDFVAITSWPADRTSLKNLFTWTAPYDESIALAAIQRVERIQEEISRIVPGEPRVPALLEIGRLFPTADACKFCEFHAPGDKRGERGCQGYDK